MANPWDNDPVVGGGGDAAPWASDPVVSAPSADSSHAEKVTAAIPQARETVAAHPWLASAAAAVPDIPIVSSALAKAVDYGRAAIGSGEGDSLSDRAGSLQARREALKQAEKEAHPFAYGTGQATGLAATLPFGGEAAGLGNALKTGAMWGTGQSVADQPNESSLSDTAGNAAEGAVLGAGTTGILHGLGTIPGMFKAAKNYLSPTSAALDTAVNASKNAGKPGLTMQDYANSPDATLADVRGMKDPLKKAAGRVPDSASLENLNDTLGERAKDAMSRVGQHIDTTMGTPIDADAIRQASIQAYQQNTSPLYKYAFQQPHAQSIQSPDLDRFLNTRTGLSAAKAAADNLSAMSFDPKGQNPAKIFDFPFEKVGGANGVWQLKQGSTAPGLEFWDAVKQELGSMYSTSGSGAEKKGLENQTKWLTQTLRNQVPEYGTALDSAKHYFGESNAFDAGIKFAKDANTATASSPGSVSQMTRAFNSNYTPQEKDMMAQGVASFLKDNPGAAMKIFSKGDSKTMDAYKQVLGGSSPSLGEIRVNQLQANLGIENMMGKLTQIQGAGHEMENHAIPALGMLHIAEHGFNGLSHILGLQMARKFAYDAPMARRAEALLDLASRSQDPAVKSQLRDALMSDATNRKVFGKIQSVIDTYAASTAGGAPQQPSDPNLQPALAAGGSVGEVTPAERFDHGAVADRLIRQAKTIKKDQSKMTEPLLDVDDNTVAHALEAANRHI